MEIGSINNISSQKSQTTSDVASNKFNEDFNSFLLLLTAQLQNQDPMAPMDSTQFVSQLSQLSQVEQSIKANTNLESIIGKLQTESTKSDIGLLGKSVQTYSNKIVLHEGNSDFLFSLSENAEEVKIKIKDENGNTIRTLTQVPTTGGSSHNVKWDGKTDSGNDSQSGIYEIEISAMNSDKEPVSTTVSPILKVNEVNLESGLSKLILNNGETIDPSKILSVKI